MKKIGKISINPEKVIKNEELVNLRGGYGGTQSWYHCECTDSSGTVHFEEDALLYNDGGVQRWIDSFCWDIHQGDCDLI